MAINRRSNVVFDRWTDYRRAVNELITTGVYRRLVAIHSDAVVEPDGFQRARHRMHGSMYGPVGYRRFLPWHRAYLIAFERELRRIDDTLSLPYWDWDNDEGRLIGVRNFIGLSTGRNLGPGPGEPPDVQGRIWFSSRQQTEDMENFEGDYYPLTRFLEQNPHNAGHDWVGGDMANTRVSPNDPIFWMHHAQIDRIWSEWQKVNAGEKAFLTGREKRLDPWGSEFDVDTIDDIGNLGNDSYEYEPPLQP